MADPLMNDLDPHACAMPGMGAANDGAALQCHAGVRRAKALQHPEPRGEAGPEAGNHDRFCVGSAGGHNHA
jgi:hypothetical protein